MMPVFYCRQGASGPSTTRFSPGGKLARIVDEITAVGGEALAVPDTERI